MKLITILAIVMCFAACKGGEEPAAGAKKPVDPTKGPAVVERALEAMGGKQKIAEKFASYSMKSKGFYFGKPYVMTTAWKAPDRMLMLMDGGALTMGYAGETCWNRFNTIVKDCMKEEQASYPETLWSYHVMTLYPLLEEGTELEYLGEAQLGEKAVDKVLVKKAGAPMPVTVSFDQKTGLAIRFEYEGSFAGMKGRITMDIPGYTEVDGMKIMTQGVMRMDGKEMMRDEYVSVDWTPLPDERFDRPAQAETGKPVLRTEPDLAVATTVHTGPYEKIGASIGRLYGWLGMNRIQPWGPPTLEYFKNPDNTDKPENYATKITIPIMEPEGEKPKSEDIRLEKLWTRRIAVQVEKGGPDDVVKAYPELREWIAAQGLILASPPSMASFSDPRNTPPEEQLHEVFYQVGEPAEDPQQARFAEAAARTFFEAMAKRSWADAASNHPRLTDGLKRVYGGIKVLELGQAFQKFPDYPGLHVPYKIQFPSGNIKEWYLALKKDERRRKWMIDGGL